MSRLDHASTILVQSESVGFCNSQSTHYAVIASGHPARRSARYAVARHIEPLVYGDVVGPQVTRLTVSAVNQRSEFLERLSRLVERATLHRMKKWWSCRGTAPRVQDA